MTTGRINQVTTIRFALTQSITAATNRPRPSLRGWEFIKLVEELVAALALLA